MSTIDSKTRNAPKLNNAWWRCTRSWKLQYPSIEDTPEIGQSFSPAHSPVFDIVRDVAATHRQRRVILLTEIGEERDPNLPRDEKAARFKINTAG